MEQPIAEKNRTLAPNSLMEDDLAWNRQLGHLIFIREMLALQKRGKYLFISLFYNLAHFG